MNWNQRRRIRGGSAAVALTLAWLGLTLAACGAGTEGEPAASRVRVGQAANELAAAPARAHPWLAMIFGIDERGRIWNEPDQVIFQRPMGLAAIISDRWLITSRNVITPGATHVLLKETWRPADGTTGMLEVARKISVSDFMLLELTAPLSLGADVAPVAFSDSTLALGATVHAPAMIVAQDGSVTLEEIESTVQKPASKDSLYGAREAVLVSAACKDYDTKHFLESALSDGSPFVVANALGQPTLVANMLDGRSCYNEKSEQAYGSIAPVITQLYGAMGAPCTGEASSWEQNPENHAVIYTDLYTLGCPGTSEQLKAGNVPLISLRGDALSEKAAMYTNVVRINDRLGLRSRVYLRYPDATPKLAEAMHWTVQVGAAAAGHDADQTCSGVSDPKGWVKYNDDTIYVDVDTTKCGFTATPSYFASLANELASPSDLYEMTVGVHAIYFPTKTGFRVHLSSNLLTPDLAKQQGWKINWTAVPTDAELCNGVTDLKAWLDDAPGTIHATVDTSACKLAQPVYFTSLTGNRSYRVAGVTAVQNVSPTSFRVTLTQPGLTAAYARSMLWRLHWMAGGK